MKKLWTLLTVSCVLLGTPWAANAEQIGVYAAPKFIWSFATTKVKIKTKDQVDHFASNLKHNFTEGTPGGALAVGYDFSILNPEASIRAEAELSFFKKISKDKDWEGVKGKHHLELGALFFNLFYDIKNDTGFIPYVGAGIGASAAKFKTELTDKSAGQQVKLFLGNKTKKNFAWNVGAGISYAFSEIFALDLGYRFASFGKAESKDKNVMTTTVESKTKTIYMHQIILGARITF